MTHNSTYLPSDGIVQQYNSVQLTTGVPGIKIISCTAISFRLRWVPGLSGVPGMSFWHTAVSIGTFFLAEAMRPCDAPITTGVCIVGCYRIWYLVPGQIIQSFIGTYESVSWYHGMISAMPQKNMTNYCYVGQTLCMLLDSSTAAVSSNGVAAGRFSACYAWVLLSHPRLCSCY